MNRFILQENIKIFRRFLSEETDLDARKTVEALLAEAIRDLARLAQSSHGSLRNASTGLLRPKKTTETPSQKRGRTGSIRMLLTATATGCAAVAGSHRHQKVNLLSCWPLPSKFAGCSQAS